MTSNNPPSESTLVIFICGVSGSGKTTVGSQLAEQLGLPYLEADTFHPKSNVDKMTSGIALTDEDRWPWLEALAVATADTAIPHGGAVTSCSALKISYREFLKDTITDVGNATTVTTRFMLLAGERETILARMATRSGHFMPPSLLDSQLNTLELPGDNESNIQQFDNSLPVADIVSAIRASL